jgi:predicted DNA-binding antitoxin AbrB/MazE fold protein
MIYGIFEKECFKTELCMISYDQGCNQHPESSLMSQALKAIYRSGTFILQTALELPEGTEVELLIQSPEVVSPPISDLEARRQFLTSLVERMQQNPIPPNAPQLTREMLHERC